MQNLKLSMGNIQINVNQLEASLRKIEHRRYGSVSEIVSDVESETGFPLYFEATNSLDEASREEADLELISKFAVGEKIVGYVYVYYIFTPSGRLYITSTEVDFNI